MRFGPIDSKLPGIFEINFTTQGEWIDKVSLKSGYTYRALEKKIINSPWHQSILFIDRISPDLPYYYESIFCEAVEEISSIEIPPRALSIRKVLIYLNGIESCLHYLAKVSLSLSLNPCFHFFMRDREKILDLFELISGSRGNPNFFRFGGVARDISDGFIERLFTLAKEFNYRLKEYDQTFFQNPSVVSLIEEIFPIENNPLSHIRRILEDDLVSLILTLEKIGSGDYFLFNYDQDFSVPVGEALKSISTPRGLAHLYVRSNGTSRPENFFVATPSQKIFRNIPEKLRGIHVSLLSPALHILGFQMGEVDK
jgi:NADH:ubiquinone oxidoreductase subunit D